MSFRFRCVAKHFRVSTSIILLLESLFPRGKKDADIEADNEGRRTPPASSNCPDRHAPRSLQSGTRTKSSSGCGVAFCLAAEMSEKPIEEIEEKAEINQGGSIEIR